MEIISNIALISINETLVVQLLSFVVFMMILNRIMIRPLQGSMSEREIYIEKLWTDISDSKKEIEDISARIESQETSARQTAHSMQKEIESLGNKEAGDILEEAKQDVRQLRRQTQAKTEAMLAASRKTLAQESASIAENFMEKALSRRLTP